MSRGVQLHTCEDKAIASVKMGQRLDELFRAPPRHIGPAGYQQNRVGTQLSRQLRQYFLTLRRVAIRHRPCGWQRCADHCRCDAQPMDKLHYLGAVNFVTNHLRAASRQHALRARI